LGLPLSAAHRHIPRPVPTVSARPHGLASPPCDGAFPLQPLPSHILPDLWRFLHPSSLSLLSSARPEENSGYTLVSRQLSPSGDGTLAPTTCSSSLLSPHHSRLGILACRPPHH
jgi:hypothetical protein